MASADPTAPAQAHSRSLDLPAAIAASVNVLTFSAALAHAGLVGRYDPDRGILVIEPPASARVIPFPPRRAADPATQDARAGMRWYNALNPAERRHWHDIAGSAVPADAWRAFQSIV